MLLGDTGSLEDIGLQFLLRSSGIHDEKGDQEHSLVLALQLLQKRLRVLAVGGQIRRNDVHVVTGTDCFLLFLDLGTVKLRDCVLDGLDRLCLVHRLDVHGDDLAGFHVEEVL